MISEIRARMPKDWISRVVLIIAALMILGSIGNMINPEPTATHTASVVTSEQKNSYGMTEPEMKATREVWEKVVRDNPEEAAAHGWT